MTLQFESAVIQNGEFVLGPIDLQFRPAAVTVVVGPNGGGKSTLLRAAAGLLPAHKGRAFLHDTQQQLKYARAKSVNEPSATAICTDQELMRIAPARRATLLSYVPQRQNLWLVFQCEHPWNWGECPCAPTRRKCSWPWNALELPRWPMNLWDIFQKASDIELHSRARWLSERLTRDY